jgi:hypothetical protein
MESACPYFFQNIVELDGHEAAVIENQWNPEFSENPYEPKRQICTYIGLDQRECCFTESSQAVRDRIAGHLFHWGIKICQRGQNI